MNQYQKNSEPQWNFTVADAVLMIGTAFVLATQAYQTFPEAFEQAYRFVTSLF